MRLEQVFRKTSVRNKAAVPLWGSRGRAPPPADPSPLYLSGNKNPPRQHRPARAAAGPKGNAARPRADRRGGRAGGGGGRFPFPGEQMARIKTGNVVQKGRERTKSERFPRPRPAARGEGRDPPLKGELLMSVGSYLPARRASPRGAAVPQVRSLQSPEPCRLIK